MLELGNDSRYEILRDLAEGLKGTELYANQPNLAAATDLLLESLFDHNSGIRNVWDCVVELEAQATNLEEPGLAGWLWEVWHAVNAIDLMWGCAENVPLLKQD